MVSRLDYIEGFFRLIDMAMKSCCNYLIEQRLIGRFAQVPRRLLADVAGRKIVT